MARIGVGYRGIMHAMTDGRTKLGRFAPGTTGQRAWRKPDDGRVTGLARVRRQPLLSAEEVCQAMSGHVLGSLKLDRERLTSLRLLGEYHGLWGTGRKPPAKDRSAKAESFSIGDAAK